MNEYINKIVNISVDNDLYFSGKLTNHKPNLYQVTGKNNHFVFWENEIIALHVEKSTDKLTIFI